MTKEWRSILGNTYWKLMWPRPNPSDACSSNFDPMEFWIQGGPLFFGDEVSAEVTFRCDMASVLCCHCEVQMDIADNNEIRQTVLYHLNMSHAYAEIKEMDRLQFGSDYKIWSQGQMSAIHSMTDMWGPIRDGGVILEFFMDKKAWIEWLRVACIIVMEWEGFDDWDWEGLKDIRNMAINKKLSPTDFHMLTVCILVFFIKTFVTCLGYYPSPMFCPPILANHHCAMHKKKFATGLF